MPAPQAIYQARLDNLTTEYTAATTLARRQRLLFLGSAALAALLLLLALRGALPARTLLLPLFAVLATLPFYLRLRTRIDRLDRLLTHVRTAVARSSGLRPQSGHTGNDLPGVDTPHLYRHDLQILGPDSLFGLLATTRTRLGRERLAHTLLHLPADPDLIRARQQAIEELAPQTALREHLALLGDHATQEIPSTQLQSWLDAPVIHVPRFTRPLLFLTSSVAALLLLAGAAHLSPWSTLRPNLAAVLALQIAVALRARSFVSPILAASKQLPRQIALLSQALALQAQTPVQAPALVDLRTSVEAHTPALARLNRTLSLVEQRNNQYFFLPALLLAVGTHSAIAIDRWRQQHAPELRLWLRCFAEFESLNAFATYAFEHPRNTYPEILPSNAPAAFEATALRHPLLPAAIAVPNDIALDPETRFYLISGSNMAGKSTLLRSVGTATVLALAGAPIPSSSARLSAFTLTASITVADSLADGKSKFLAEVERLHAILQATQSDALVLSNTDDPAISSSHATALPTSPATVISTEGEAIEAIVERPASPPETLTPLPSASSAGAEPARPTRAAQPVLFLIDEIFSGTNSADRLTAAAAVLRQLIARGALGALSTHDLALTTLTQPTMAGTHPLGRNVHMASPDPENPLAFDYLLKPGINPSTNALAILRLIGIEP